MIKLSQENLAVTNPLIFTEGGSSNFSQLGLGDEDTAVNIGRKVSNTRYSPIMPSEWLV